MAWYALLVPEALLLLLVLAAHQLLGQPVWSALLGLGLALLFLLRMTLLYSARQLISRGSYRAAYYPIRAALCLHPWSADSWSLLATLELARGQVQLAEQALRRSIRYMPGQAPLHAALSGVLLEAGHEQAAQATALQALQYDPWNTTALLHLVGAERRLGAATLAEQRIVQALGRHPASSDEAALRCVLAELLVERGSIAAAAFELRRVETLLERCHTPQRAALHCHIGALLRQLARSDEALLHFRSAERIDPYGRYAQMAWREARS
jgi:tetratricopeptide (TPR) repeat protein